MNKLLTATQTLQIASGMQSGARQAAFPCSFFLLHESTGLNAVFSDRNLVHCFNASLSANERIFNCGI